MKNIRSNCLNSSNFLITKENYTITAKNLGLSFYQQGLIEGSLENLTKLGIKRVKVPSGEITNTPFLEYIASLNLPIILSTGMSTLGEIEQALKTLNDSGAKNQSITVLHCTSNYPAHDDELNLRALSVISSSFNVAIGYSDHSLVKKPLSLLWRWAQPL